MRGVDTYDTMHLDVKTASDAAKPGIIADILKDTGTWMDKCGTAGGDENSEGRRCSSLATKVSGTPGTDTLVETGKVCSTDVETTWRARRSGSVVYRRVDNKTLPAFYRWETCCLWANVRRAW